MVQPWPSSPTCIPATVDVHHEKAGLEGDGYGIHLGWARFGAGPCGTQAIILRIEKIIIINSVAALRCVQFPNRGVP
jgi:hypothetical protein